MSLGDALRTLTRFPLPAKKLLNEERMLFWFPLVGALLGLFSWLVCLLPLPTPVRSVLVIALGAYLTRGFHWDGLADFADGLGGGWTKERALAIMKDSHSGAFAVITVTITLLMQYSCLLMLVRFPLVVVLAPVFGRYMQVLAASFLPYAREGEGTASALVRGAKKRHILFPSLQMLLLLALLALTIDHRLWLASLSSFAISFITTLVVLHIARKRLGGVTGDVLGAVEVLSETAALLGFLLPLA